MSVKLLVYRLHNLKADSRIRLNSDLFIFSNELDSDLKLGDSTTSGLQIQPESSEPQTNEPVDNQKSLTHRQHMHIKTLRLSRGQSDSKSGPCSSSVCRSRE